MNEPRRIACFHLNQVGDLLFSLPAIYNLRLRFPDAKIISVARPYLKDLLRLSRTVDQIIERPWRPLGAGFKIVSALRKEKLDLAVVFSTSLGMTTLARLSGASVRVGFEGSEPRPFLTHSVPKHKPPSLLANLRLVETIGCSIVKSDYAGLLHPGEEERGQADAVLKSAGIGECEPFAVLSPSTSTRREIKSWSDEGFAKVADGISYEFGMRSVVVGTDNGSRICSSTANAVDISGKTSLPVLAALLERSSVFVGVDSGVMHLASVMQTPVAALFGPSDPDKTGPQGGLSRVVCADLVCRPCLRCECANDRQCMEGITPDAVLSAVHALIVRESRQVSMA